METSFFFGEFQDGYRTLDMQAGSWFTSIGIHSWAPSSQRKPVTVIGILALPQALRAAAIFDQFPQLVEDFRAVEQLAILGLASTSFEFRFELLKRRFI